MSTPTEIATALQATVATATGLNFYDHVPQNVQPPAAFIPPPAVDFNVSMQRGLLTLQYRLYVFTGLGDARAAQLAMYDYMPSGGSRSIDAAIRGVDGQGTLGLTDTKANVDRCAPLGIEEIAAYGYLGGAWDITVYTQGV